MLFIICESNYSRILYLPIGMRYWVVWSRVTFLPVSFSSSRHFVLHLGHSSLGWWLSLATFVRSDPSISLSEMKRIHLIRLTPYSKVSDNWCYQVFIATTRCNCNIWQYFPSEWMLFGTGKITIPLLYTTINEPMITLLPYDSIYSPKFIFLDTFRVGILKSLVLSDKNSLSVLRARIKPSQGWLHLIEWNMIRHD